MQDIRNLSYARKATIGGRLKKLSMHGDVVSCTMAIVTNQSSDCVTLKRNMTQVRLLRDVFKSIIA
jgi:hypothetical protein